MWPWLGDFEPSRLTKVIASAATSPTSRSSVNVLPRMVRSLVSRDASCCYYGHKMRSAYDTPVAIRGVSGRYKGLFCRLYCFQSPHHHLLQSYKIHRCYDSLQYRNRTQEQS